MQTPYGALSYQTRTSRNCKPFRTQLCKLLLAAHKIQTHLKLHAVQLKQLTQTQIRPLHDRNAYSDPCRNIKVTIFHNNEHPNIIISKPDIILEVCRENLKHIHSTTTSQTSVLEKTTKLLTPHPMTFIHQNKNYHIICVQNKHSSEPTNHSCKVTYIQ